MFCVTVSSNSCERTVTVPEVLKGRVIKLEQLDAKLPVRDIFARKIFDCRGNPTVETEVLAGENIVGRVSVPSGLIMAGLSDSGTTVKRQDEISALADRMIENINTHIAQELIGKNVLDQQEIDSTMIRLDGTEDKSVLGAAALFSVSAAAASAAAAALGIPLYRYLGGAHAKSIPMPAVPVIRGGKTGEDGPDVRGILIVPTGRDTFCGQISACIEIGCVFRHIALVRGISVCEKAGGGYVTESSDIREVLRLLRAAAEQAGYRWGRDVTVALDAAASNLYDPVGKCYRFTAEGVLKGREICRNTREMISYYEELAAEFPICSIADALDQEDWEGWGELTERMGRRMQLVGGDLFGGNLKRLEKGIRLGAANAVSVRTGQTGTLTGMADLLKAAREAGYGVLLADQEGETADTLQADLAVAYGVSQIRFGAPGYAGNTEKYNQLLRICERLGKSDECGGEIC